MSTLENEDMHAVPKENKQAGVKQSCKHKFRRNCVEKNDTYVKIANRENNTIKFKLTRRERPIRHYI